MKRFSSLIMALLIIFSNTFIAKANSMPMQDTAKMNSYEINAELNVTNQTLIATEKITYVNNTNTSLNEIYFHLYPNAFKSKDTTPVVSFNGNIKTNYPAGFRPGFIDITSIKAENAVLGYNISGNDKTILKVSLVRILYPGDQIQLSISFKDTIPLVVDRFGYVNNTYNLGNWYPIAAVYDNARWHLDPFYNLGDPFYSDASSYKVNITVPQNFVVAGTGSSIISKPKNKKRVYTFEESPVRDFAWVASSDLKISQKKVDGVNIKCYYFNGYEDKNKIALSAAENSIKTFDKYYGQYPYSTYSVVATNFPSGMEFPGIVFISNYYYTYMGSKYLASTIAHETAHQWWYGVIGDNEIEEAWLDESFAAYSEVVFTEKVDGMEAGRNYFKTNVSQVFDSQKSAIKNGEIIAMPLNKFNGWADYGALVYRKGAIMLNDLRSTVGDDVFFQILQNYYSDYMFKNAKTTDFIAEVEKVTNKDWKDYFDKWLYQ